MAAKGPLREFGTDPVSERPVVAKDGKFGVYVTDGETNASIGKGDRIEEMLARAGLRAAGDPPRGGRRQGWRAGEAHRPQGPGQEGRRQEERRGQEVLTVRACEVGFPALPHSDDLQHSDVDSLGVA